MGENPMNEKTALGGFWVKWWPRVNGEWEVRDSNGVRDTLDTEDLAKAKVEELLEQHRNTETFRLAFIDKFGTD